MLLSTMLLVSNIFCLAHPNIVAYLHIGRSQFKNSPTKAQHFKAIYLSSHRRRSTPLLSSNGDGSDGWNLFKLRPSERTSNEPPYGYCSPYQQYRQNDKENSNSAYITREMEQQVMTSARSRVDDNTVSRAISSLVADDVGRNNDINRQRLSTDVNNRKGNSLRDLAGSVKSSTITPKELRRIDKDDTNTNSWDTQQIALASGITTLILSPVAIPIIHSLIPPLIPFPASISFEGAAFLGALAYILALGDPADQSNVISQTTSGGMLGDGVEVTGAVSRIVGRTALQSVQTSAPRLKAVARAVVDYDSTVNTMEEMKEMQYQLSRRLLELESENESLKQEVALWNAAEDVSSTYKLEDLTEMARVNGVRGYSSDGKAALLRRLVKERVLNIDLSPYYRELDEMA